MKKIYFIISSMFLIGILACSCSDDEKGTTPETKLELTDGTSDRQEIFADQTSPDGKGIRFTSQGPWRAEVEEVVRTKAEKKPVDWVILSQYSGDKAGSYTITLTLTPNFTGKERQAVIRIICGDTEITITIVQKGVIESGTAPKIVKEVVYTEEYGKNAELNWGKPETQAISYYYDERGRVAKVIRTSQYEGESKDIYTYTFDYDVVGEITITVKENNEERIAKILAKLDNLGRVVKVEDQNNLFEEADAYQFGYNEAGQLAKMTYIGGMYDGNWDKYGYTDGMLNETTEWWDGKEDNMVIPLEQLYPNRYSANNTNIDLNSMEWFGEEVINLLYGMRLLGVGSKCLLEIALVYDDVDASINIEGYPTPNQTIKKEHMYIKEREEGEADKRIYEFDNNKYVTRFYSHQPYTIMHAEYDIVVGNELVDPEEPRRGYKWEMKNRTDTKIGEDKNTYTYTVRYQD